MFLRHLAFSVLVFLLALPAKADSYALENPFGGSTFTDPNEIVAAVINVALGILGVVVLVFMIYAGFLWMTAGGAEDKLTKAKNIFIWTIVGMVAILASYAILDFVFDVLIEYTDTQ